MRISRAILCASAIFFSHQAFACGDQLAAILKRAYPDAVFNDPAQTGGEQFFDLAGSTPVRVRLYQDVTCKIWPAHPELMLVAVTQSHLPLVSQEQAADLDILVIDTRTGQLVQRLREDGMLDSDAERASLEGIDTARYSLNPGKPVFGIRIRRLSGAHGWSSSNDTLRLYAIEESRLAQVLELATAVEHRRGKAMTEHPHKRSCGDTEDMKRTIAAAKQQHKGFNDLIVRTSSAVSLCYEQSEDAAKWITSPRRHSSQRYIYDGQSYVMPGKAAANTN